MKIKETADIIKSIIADHPEYVQNLSYSGPRGGHNAKTFGGWSACRNAIISKAALLAGCPRHNWWDRGTDQTPNKAIPSAVLCELDKTIPKY